MSQEKGPDYYFQLGCTNMQSQHYTAAGVCLKEAIRLNPREFRYYEKLGKAHYYQGQLHEASKAILTARALSDLERNPVSKERHFLLNKVNIHLR